MVFIRFGTQSESFDLSRQEMVSPDRAPSVPERNLCADLLARAFQDLLLTEKVFRSERTGWKQWEKTTLREDALEWFTSDREGFDDGIPFIECCKALNLDHEFIRRLALEKPESVGKVIHRINKAKPGPISEAFDA